MNMVGGKNEELHFTSEVDMGMPHPDSTQSSALAGGFFTTSTIWEAHKHS